jgi:heat shock protein HslJ
MKRLLLLILSLILTVASQAQISYFLSNKFWRLKQATINSQEHNLGGNSNAPTLQFSGGSIRGNGGCNAYHTKFTINGNSLYIEKVMSTRMACNELSLDESEYFNALAQSHTIEYEEGADEFRLINTSNDVLVYYAQFAKAQSTYIPPPARRETVNRTYRDEVEYIQPKLSKKQQQRKALLEKKLKKKKLTKAERRELIVLQSKTKKGKISKFKRGKLVKERKRHGGKKVKSRKSKREKGRGKKTKEKVVKKKTNKKKKRR